MYDIFMQLPFKRILKPTPTYLWRLVRKLYLSICKSISKLKTTMNSVCVGICCLGLDAHTKKMILKLCEKFFCKHRKIQNKFVTFLMSIRINWMYCEVNVLLILIFVLFVTHMKIFLFLCLLLCCTNATQIFPLFSFTFLYLLLLTACKFLL